ncbi:MAG: hypothetical protein GTO53_04985 [Planctomycetales bacterium]|nr:hypothetical protein [Planctomycetales bacterium]NIM08508.1 hypothetical protein [Planctomycetales bacterium]NIN07982.1 hypothetical protein [Planctomycetales bacterium]NIN77111.1 hypothetical protein [Planctomycetales bacterium]NIO34291.1 hypothetical protein [Planctomycetales bacterium]
MSILKQAAEPHPHVAVDFPSPVKFTPRGYGHHEFMASLLPGVFERKLMHLIEETNATLKSFTDDSIQLELGNTLLFVRDKPVNEVKVDVFLTIHRDSPCPNSMTHVVVDIQPLDRVTRDLFESRCNQIVRVLHACLLAYDLRYIS